MFFTVLLVLQMEQIKRANKLFSNDCIFLRNSLNIPVLSEKRSIFNGLSLESPDGDGETACQDARTPHVMTQDIEGPSPPSSPPPQPQPQPEELSAKDFLHRLDLQIKQSKQAAQRLKEEEVRSHMFVGLSECCFMVELLATNCFFFV
ncbi:LysM and putative peptidoglycan-binding domain-containing protein 2 [Goodea atripinnis]|uniref:LysM and putative peptidoglycan-binding domain-containing protein 2 n=1 Tax=Goodea atripinnis TaxID=208336 RepID=A0ABV0NPG9_9TELE